MLSSDEKAIASWVMTHGRSMGLYDDDSLATTTSARFVQRVVVGITQEWSYCASFIATDSSENGAAGGRCTSLARPG